MPTVQQRQQKRKQKREEKRVIKLHSTIGVGHRQPVPSPPDFGQPRWTEEEQAAHPDKPMTRLVKDVLRVGRWKEGFDEVGRPIFGDYTETELQGIHDRAIAMMNSGHAINIGKSHGDDQLIIPTDELISPIDDIRLCNGVLWVSTYVTPEQAAYLKNPSRKVSAGLHRDYTAGDGTVYKGRTMLHVAATDRPVVDRQGPFIQLSNYIALGSWDESKHKRSGGKFSSTGGGAAKTQAVTTTPAGPGSHFKKVSKEYNATYSKAKKITAAHGVQTKSVRGQIQVHSDDPAKLDAAFASLKKAGMHVKKATKDPRAIVGGEKPHLTVHMKPKSVLRRILKMNNAIAFGTWEEAKHKRNKGKFASSGSKPTKAQKKTKEAKKAVAIAGAGLATGAKIGVAEKAVGTGAKYAAKAATKAGLTKVVAPIAKRAGKAAGSAAKKAGNLAGRAFKAGGKAASRVAIRAAGAGKKKAGEYAVAIARRGAKKLKKLGIRTAKAGAKAAKSGAKAGLRVAKSQGVRKGLQAGGSRALKIGAKILRTVGKSPLRKAVLRFQNQLLIQSAIALANNLEGGGSMDPTILAGINALLAKLGLEPIPDGTPPEQIGPILTGIAIGIGLSPEEEINEEEEDPNALPAIDPAALGGAPNQQPVAMANLLSQLNTSIDQKITASQKPLIDGLAALTTLIQGKQAVEVDDKKANWIKFRNALGKAGVTEAVLAAKDKLGEKNDWNTEILEGLSPTIKMSNLVSAAAATEENPADAPQPGAPLTDEQVAARILEKGGDVTKMPGYRPAAKV